MSFPDDAPAPGVEGEDAGQDSPPDRLTEPGRRSDPLPEGDVAPGGIPAPATEEPADSLAERRDDGGATEGGAPEEPGPAPLYEDPVAAAARERDDYLDALRRLQADFENYKKRMAKQQSEQLERANEALVQKLLPVLDTADLALAHGAGEDLKQVLGALNDTLGREGLERIDPAGSPFDPNLHDAVAHEPGDEDGQIVSEVMRAGYRWRGRMLRPAMVKVRG